MNIQLYLADQELELVDNFSFPLNKTYENLSNPTDIVVDYSKSINVPITIHNNKIFANAYRLDKAVSGSSDENIGLYLNPTKRIPFKLIHNGRLLMEGYAKFVSATNSISNRYYTINLFGVIGEVFQELLNVVTDAEKLNGLDYKYVLDDSKYFTSNNKLNKTFIQNSWNRDNPTVYVPDTTKNYDIYDMYGFAPSHRGLYKDFKANQIQVSDTSIKSISEVLKTAWNDTEDRLGADNLVGDGFPDYQMNQFMSTRLKPYVYFNHLMRMYADKCKELTGYDLNLDSNWFNANNPYWSKVIYMLDFLDLDVVRQQNLNSAILIGETEEVAGQNSDVENKTASLTMGTISVGSSSNYGNSISTGKFDINFGVSATHTKAYRDNSLSKNVITLNKNTQIRFQININRINGNAASTVKTVYYWTNAVNNVSLSNSGNFNSSNFIQCSMINKESYSQDRFATVRYYVTIPDIKVNADFSTGYSIDVITSYYNDIGKTEENVGGTEYSGPDIYDWDWQYSSNYLAHRDYIYSTDNELEGAGDKNNVTSKGNNSEWYVSINNSKYLKNWNSDIKVNIANLYQQEEPLFKVILQYTKMFGLIWDVDYASKKIFIKTRYEMFKDKTITNWDDKLDRTKDMIIEPITFDHKCVLFNYKNVNGNRYSTYRDKYGLNIGEKKLYTEYEFNANDKTLFKDIYPSSVSSNVYVPYKTLLSWNTVDALITSQEQRVLIDCATEDEKNSISINNWYFRDSNITDNDVMIIEETPYMSTSNTYCYIESDYALNSGYAIKTNVFPTISTTVKFKNITYGMFFNTPNVDYTYTGQLQHTLNTNIYNLFWKDYINEKYNVQNKKVTAYFHLNPSDFNSFKFNKLVTLQNQVFLVNKIIDYNLNTTNTTKCELIQISDLDALTSKTF